MHLATLRHGLPGVAHLVQLQERMALQPLGHRILVKPDEPPEATDSGLVLPGQRDHVPTSGVVVAVGNGPSRDAFIRSASILRCMSIVDELSHLDYEGDNIAAIRDEMRRYKNHVERYDGALKVGDRVVYPANVGLTVQYDGIDYILLSEDDAVAIATEEAEAAA